MQPKVYLIDQHRIPHNKIDKHAYYVIEKLRQKGFTAYLVGGSVRDLLLNCQPKDFDISTSAKPEEIKKLFPNCILIGKRFRLAHIRFGKKILEVSTFRSGDNEKSALILRDNIWGNPEEDVLRRDFTINGLFYDPETQSIIDYVGGFLDTEKKILRAIGKPHLRFIQDPVRMIRLLKFQARFNFEIDEDTHKALQDCKKEIIKSSSVRIFEELLRMLESGVSKNFFQLLQQHGLLQKLTPALATHFDESCKETIFSLLNQIDHFICDQTPKSKMDRSVLLSALLFPILEKQLINQQEYLHLGLIAEKASDLLSEIFRPFFFLPRRMKAAIISILTNQFRFTPLIEAKKNKMRIPKDPFFPLSVYFLYFRAQVSKELLPIYQSWYQLIKKKRFISKKPIKKKFLR